MTKAALKKVHVGCGSVYLDGYINVDLYIPGLSFKVDERPDLVMKNLTTVDKYYKNKVTRSDIESKRHHTKKIVVDVFADARNLPFSKNSLDEIRSVQLFEHFTYSESEKILKHWHSLLKPGGLLHIDVPDLDETLRRYLQAKTKKDKQWYIRLLYGSQKNEFGIHRAMYSRQMLKSLLIKHGFSKIREFDNIHFYPAFAFEARKR